MGASERGFLFVYATPGDPVLETLILPYGR
jgi:hypothetical protein